MSNTGMIIEERSRDIGDFLVGRLIPFRKKRMVGPFIFIDHMGPSKVGAGKYLDVGQHPHIGLSTLTYLMEGTILHRDSIGSVQRIEPGSVNWMTAGSGVVHTERTPTELRGGSTHTLHGYQIWVALPKVHEEITPSFHHVSKDDIPRWSQGGFDIKLLAGKAFNRQSPVPVYSPLFMLDIQANKTDRFVADGQLNGEIGICVVNGQIQACGEQIGAGNMLVSKTNDLCDIQVDEGTHLLIFGGEAFPEERFIYWNFVSTSKERIETAKQDWAGRKFDMVPEESDYVPLPGMA
ncbi:MAG: pirin family protein [Bacteroidota bacterium]